jgi:isopenicillin N synthase-like dioxygenase
MKDLPELPLNSASKDLSFIVFYKACTELTNTVLQAFALALELPEDFFTSRHNQENHTLRTIHRYK